VGGVEVADRLAALVRDIPDFPRPGITFKDLTPLLADPHAFRAAVDGIADRFSEAGVSRVLGVEARGFILAAPIAYRFGAGFTPVRKAGKLPWQVETEEYELEYGTDLLEIHKDAIEPGERILVIDDVLATGGTAAAACALIEGLGASVVGVHVLLELGFLSGRARLGARDVRSLLVEA
jgi:adenine phosphoribosyltransferase